MIVTTRFENDDPFMWMYGQYRGALMDSMNGNEKMPEISMTTLINYRESGVDVDLIVAFRLNEIMSSSGGFTNLTWTQVPVNSKNGIEYLWLPNE